MKNEKDQKDHKSPEGTAPELRDRPLKSLNSRREDSDKSLSCCREDTVSGACASPGYSGHGGDCYRNTVRLDLSVNLNPLGMPDCFREALERGIQCAGRYPDLLQEAPRRAAALFYSERYKEAFSPEEILPGNGASELITAVYHGLRPRRVLLTAPCFTGYLHGVDPRETKPDRYATGETLSFQPDAGFGMMIRPDTELVILNNPCNPGGGMLDRKLLRDLLKLTAERHIPVLLDECFLEFTGRLKDSGLRLMEEYPNLMVLRAFTKSFSMPGVRLGLLFVRDRRLREKVRRALPEWNLSAFGQEVLITASERRTMLYDFLDRTAEKTGELRNRMEERLIAHGIQVIPSTANFLLTRGLGEYADQLLKQGILVRRCRDMQPLSEEYIRLAVRTAEEQDQFFDALRRIRADRGLPGQGASEKSGR